MNTRVFELSFWSQFESQISFWKVEILHPMGVIITVPKEAVFMSIIDKIITNIGC